MAYIVMAHRYVLEPLRDTFTGPVPFLVELFDFNGKVKRCESVQVFCVETCNTNAKTRKSFVVPRKRLARITKSLSLPSLPSRKGPSLRGTFPVNLETCFKFFKILDIKA